MNIYQTTKRVGAIAVFGVVFYVATANATPAEDKALVGALDIEYQAAVKRHDEATLERIMADDFVLITGRGEARDKKQLLQYSKAKHAEYEKQDELSQVVRVWGDTATVTAQLWVKGTTDGSPMDRKVWFTDVYTRTSAGWKYVLGQVGQIVEVDGKPVRLAPAQ